jgi:hypothetical protein
MNAYLKSLQKGTATTATIVSAVRVGVQQLEQPGEHEPDASLQYALYKLAKGDLHKAVAKDSNSYCYQAALHLLTFVQFCKAQAWQQQPVAMIDLEQLSDDLQAVAAVYGKARYAKRRRVQQVLQRHTHALQQQQQQDAAHAAAAAAALPQLSTPSLQQQPEQDAMEVDYGDEQPLVQQVGVAGTLTVNTSFI